MKNTNSKFLLKAAIIVALAFFNFIMFMPQQCNAQQGTWISNGNTVVYTNRKVGVKTNLPVKDFDVNGSFRSINAFVDSVIKTWQLIVTDALSVGQFTLSDNNIFSSTGNINFGNNNLTTTGTISSSNISVLSSDVDTLQSAVGSLQSAVGSQQSEIGSLQTAVSGQQVEIDTLQSAVGNIKASQWTTNPDSSISFNGKVFVKSLNAVKVISIGHFQFSNGGDIEPPPTPIRDSISTPNEMVLKSEAKAISMSADTVRVKPSVGGQGLFDVQGNIVASGNISSDAITSNSIQTSQLTITDGTFTTDTLHAKKQLTVNNSLKIAKEDINNYAEVSTKDTAITLVLQKEEAGQVVIGPADTAIIPLPGQAKDKLTVIGNTNLLGSVNVSGNVTTNTINALNMNVTGQTSFDSLHVTNTVKIGNSIIINGLSNTSTTNFIYTTPSSGNLYIQCASNQNTIINGNSTGRVGIGASVPVCKLNVLDNNVSTYSPTAAPIPSFRLDNFNDSHTNLQYTSIGFQTKDILLGGNTAVGAITLVQPSSNVKNGDFTFTLRNTNGDYNEIMRMQSDGKVGIGTTDPTANLHIKGITDFGVLPGGGEELSSTILRIEDNVINSSNDRNVYWDYTVSGLQQKMFISNNINGTVMTFKENGDCGVGTTSPSAKFDVQGNMRISDLATTEAGTNNLIQVGENGILTPLSTTTAGIGLWQQNGTDIYNTNSGKVGIGTNNPEATLHVLSNCENSGTTLRLQYNYTPPIQNGCTSGISLWDIAALPDNILTFTNPTLIQPAITILQDGKVGVGTLTPGAKLDVVGGDVRILNIAAPTGTNNLVQVGDNGILSSVTPASIGIELWQSSNGTDIYHNTGKVGIGTTTPLAKLHITSSNGEPPPSIRLEQTEQIEDDEEHEPPDYLDYTNWDISNVGGALVFKSNSYSNSTLTQRLAIGNNGYVNVAGNAKIAGNVGIGTNPPTGYKLAVDGNTFINGNVGIGANPLNYELEVNGTIKACEVRVNLTGCDFVFDKNYPMFSMKLRKQKVLTQGHLLNIESAKDKTEFSLNNLTQGIWQNVEDHELYLYNHDERIEKLEQTVELLIKENKEKNIQIELLKKEIRNIKK